MTEQQVPRRAVALLHSDHDPTEFEALVQRHGLSIVYAVHTDVHAVLVALIAVQYALEHLADAVVIPHLGVLKPDTPWWGVTEMADLITGTRAYPLGSALPTTARWAP